MRRECIAAYGPLVEALCVAAVGRFWRLGGYLKRRLRPGRMRLQTLESFHVVWQQVRAAAMGAMVAPMGCGGALVTGERDHEISQGITVRATGPVESRGP